MWPFQSSHLASPEDEFRFVVTYDYCFGLKLEILQVIADFDSFVCALRALFENHC